MPRSSWRPASPFLAMSLTDWDCLVSFLENTNIQSNRDGQIPYPLSLILRASITLIHCWLILMCLCMLSVWLCEEGRGCQVMSLGNSLLSLTWKVQTLTDRHWQTTSLEALRLQALTAYLSLSDDDVSYDNKLVPLTAFFSWLFVISVYSSFNFFSTTTTTSLKTTKKVNYLFVM